MPPIILALTLLATTGLLLTRLAVRVRSRPRTGFIEIAPSYRSFFRQLGVTEAAHFLALPGATPHIVSGHPDRHVARITFGSGGEQWSAFLKCEHRVSWRNRLSNALASFGLLSRSLREARTLQALQREGLPAPEWLAAGEDGQGRAFLLVREAPGKELRFVLTAEKERGRRRRIARMLGAALARLHTAGFRHPDLYGNHVFVDCDQRSSHLLDWPRAYLRPELSWRERRRDFAALHATVDDALATPEERLLCLRAYWRLSAPLGVSWQAAVQGVERQARRLLTRRHIREKRQPPPQPQAWICLAGEALCVTPVLRERCGEHIPDYLCPRNELSARVPSLRRRWPVLPDAGRALLVQRQHPKARASLWPSSRRSLVSPEQRQASLLLRLQRHGIAAPQVLALGHQRGADGTMESVLLTEPLTDTCSLEAWLSCRTRRRAGPSEARRRWSVLRQAGALLQRLHEASCYLDFGPSGCGLAVRQADDQLAVVLDRVESVTPRRRPQPRRAARDVRRLQHLLRAAGCSRSDLCRFRSGYHQAEAPRSPAAVSSLMKAIPAVLRRPFAPLIEQSAPERNSFWRRLILGIRRWRQRADWPRFAGHDWPDHIMDLAVTDRFEAKQGRSTGRWILHASADTRRRPGRLSVFLKRHYQLPWWQGWLATLWPGRSWSPAWQEGRHLQWARSRGLPVPQLVAAAEYIGPWGKLRSVLAVEELAGMLSLQEAIPLAAVRQDAHSFRQWKRGLAVEMARLTRMLHDRRCFHKDFYLCHFFIAGEDTRRQPEGGWRGRVHLIDLHRLAHHPRTWKIWQTKDLAQLLYASEIVGIDARDRLTFWRAYTGDGPDRPRCPVLRYFILYRWRRYRHHNARTRKPRQDG
jgi:tRNA A-37 threonylcarbamoyl transferase component Bud32